MEISFFEEDENGIITLLHQEECAVWPTNNISHVIYEFVVYTKWGNVYHYRDDGGYLSFKKELQKGNYDFDVHTLYGPVKKVNKRIIVKMIE
jgi:hypothetical protein